MEDNIPLFNNYINQTLTPEEEAEFDKRLKSDKSFREEFRIYLFTLRGIIMEAEGDNMEFAYAVKNLSQEDFEKAIFRNPDIERFTLPSDYFSPLPSVRADYSSAIENDVTGDDDVRFSSVDEVFFKDSNLELNAIPSPSETNIMLPDSLAEKTETPSIKTSKRRIRERFLWISSIAALFIVGLFTVISVARNGDNQVDDVIAYYNQWATTSPRGGFDDAPDLSSLSGKELSVALKDLRSTYDNPEMSIQEREMAGFSLAIYYVKKHNRKEAKEILNEMIVKFAHDDEFTATCREVLKMLD